MRKLAYITIDDSLTPLKAAQTLALAKKSGFEEVIVLHEKNAPFYTTAYKEKLLSLFRAAYRNKVKLYIGDDCCEFSGTGFGQVGSVRDVRVQGMCRKNKSEVSEGEEIIAENGDECVVKFVYDDAAAKRFEFCPDVTAPECAQLVIDCVYKPLLREYSKFKGYELAGFFCKNPEQPMITTGRKIYMKAVVERFEKEYGRKPDFFEIVEGKGDFDNYESLAEECVKENFLTALKDCCESNGVELMVGSLFGEYVDFCEENNLINITDMGDKDSYQIHVADAGFMLDCVGLAKGCVIGIMPSMAKLSKLWEFLMKNSDAEVVEAEKFISADKDCYIIRGTNLKGAISFLLEGDWCILDWENDAVYDFDKKRAYNFGLSGFLCIRRKTADMYPDPLPARVGAVMTRELEYVKPIDFVQEGLKFKFTLPEEGLTGKYIGISQEGEYTKLKMGYNTYECITYPRNFPLYDFLGGSECEGEVEWGNVRGIAIYEKKTY